MVQGYVSDAEIYPYVIVDDMVCSGNTITRIHERIMGETDDKALLMGVFVYNEHFYDSEGEHLEASATGCYVNNTERYPLISFA
jgi:orotate phosphoribosyltransferase-like protein